MPSWDIIEAICDPLNECEICVILAYRNNLEKYRSKVKSMLYELHDKSNILEIKLESLSFEEVKKILYEVFGEGIVNLEKLAG